MYQQGSDLSRRTLPGRLERQVHRRRLCRRQSSPSAGGRARGAPAPGGAGTRRDGLPGRDRLRSHSLHGARAMTAPPSAAEPCMRARRRAGPSVRSTVRARHSRCSGSKPQVWSGLEPVGSPRPHAGRRHRHAGDQVLVERTGSWHVFVRRRARERLAHRRDQAADPIEHASRSGARERARPATDVPRSARSARTRRGHGQGWPRA